MAPAGRPNAPRRPRDNKEESTTDASAREASPSHPLPGGVAELLQERDPLRGVHLREETCRGSELMALLRGGATPEYVRPLPPVSLPVPRSLLSFAERVAEVGISAALRRLVDHRSLPRDLSPSSARYASGPLETRYHARDKETSEFLASLHHHVAAHSRSAICGWDLFHSHLIVSVEPPDVALLFHAKEFPIEYVASSSGIHAVGAPAAGGTLDPRRGSKLSIFDANYSERNVLWLASTNRAYMILPHGEGFPVELLSPFAPYHFSTVSEAAFCPRAVCDVNYFPREDATSPHPAAAPPLADAVSLSVYAPYAQRIGGRAASQLDASDSLASPRGRRVRARRGDDAARAAAPSIPSEWQPSEEWCARRRTAQLDASRRFERLLAGQPAHAPRGRGLWAVLIGGESGSSMVQDPQRTRPGKWMGSHTSLQAIGRAYAQLAPVLGRDRVIVIAQLRETLEWLEAASESDEGCLRVAGATRHRALLQRRLEETRRDCALLLADGGADYDYEAVNSATVLRVLRGDDRDGAEGGGQGRPRGRVIPASATAVLVMLNSHGNAHPRNADSPNQGRDEHYTLFPYPAPESEQEALYATVAWAGDAEVMTAVPYGPRKYLWRLYATQLFQALLDVFTRHPHRQVVLLNQSCLAEGQARYLFHEPFVRAFRTDAWHVLHMSTAEQYEPSLGTFWECFLAEFARAVERPVLRITLGQVYNAAKAQYYAVNCDLKQHNEVVRADQQHSPFTPRSFGTPNIHEGRARDGRFMTDVAVWELLNELELEPGTGS
ncbi:hypothetical protein AB1Y20_015193 [Prymnesium parvum]|uniref:Protein xylosyltransferase n=1 Tax=Prymnesium parvum TaxID=97485 RepID=A0AB34JZP8_PRYPA